MRCRIISSNAMDSHTALLGTVTTFRDRSIFRELGKVYGLPKEEIDQLVDNPSPATKDDITRSLYFQLD